MSEHSHESTPRPGGILVTLWEHLSLQATEAPKVGSNITLWYNPDFPVPVIAYLDDATSLGILPCRLAEILVEDFLEQDRTLFCTVEDFYVPPKGRVWVQARIVAEDGTNLREYVARRSALSSIDQERSEAKWWL